ncbi:MAG: YcaQ family DNA glycosylase [Candidatus Eisenbacteria bacterium]|nr:YcaQ family DNA glycosylase [Candidatus Eisenbacteria bacterium]
MSTPVTVSRRGVAALFLQRQQLDRPRTRRLTARTLEDFVAGVGGLQIDSVNVIERAHHLTLWSRFGAYDRATFERLAYEKRLLLEYLSHVACFVAARDLPLWRATMADVATGPWPLARWAKGKRKLIEAVEAEVRARAPIGNGGFERPKGQKGGGWWTWKPAMHALDYLWKSGRIAVHSRRHFQKLYAPMDVVMPHASGVPPVASGTLIRERLLRSLAAMGVASDDDLVMYWTWPRRPAPLRRDALAQLVREGEVREVRVEGLARKWYVRAADLPALESATRARRASRGTTLLCPFDSFLWHRERTLRLFGFFYRIEIYVPGAQRTHGYYTLPLLHEGQLIGRVDLKNHREQEVLEVRHAHFEPWFAAGEPPPARLWAAPDRDEAVAGLAGALHSLARFLGCAEVSLARTSPAGFKPALTRALAAPPDSGERP